jgi:diaminohydroxyphosphoribosylaminopyrimidine deaminase / 5-amino-6-(5-phosphoribosylamino)uracil reductase
MPASARSGAFSDDDRAHMQAALGLAGRGLGEVWPNPSVGCVIVSRTGQVVGRARTARGGRPHAETQALAQAGAAASEAVVYVTLEPCSHFGKTPPCVEALIAAGVGRVVVACKDPDPRVQGRGIARLQAAGIPVDVGVLADEAQALNAGFFLRVMRNRPWVTQKLATTLDGRIATRSGQSRWITGPVARAWGHALRARHDAIMVGINTALADDPDLSCRLPGLASRSPIRIVVDSRLRLPLTSRLVRSAVRVPTWILTLRGGGPIERQQAMRDCGVEVMEIEPDQSGGLPISHALSLLAGRGLTRVLAEGGSRLAASLFQADLVDQVEWFRAASVIGGDGLAAVSGFGLDRLADAPRFHRTAIQQAGDDVLESYSRIVGAIEWVD